jgi:FKBP-type peptidyl-prolyl cis-trans isomerase FklB
MTYWKRTSLAAVLMMGVVLAADPQPPGGKATDPKPQTKTEPKAETKPETKPAPGPKPTTVEEKASYGMGYTVGRQIKARITADTLKFDMYVAGLKAALMEVDPACSEEEMAACVDNVLRAGMKKVAEKRTMAGEAFRMKNKSREGVKETASGIQYEIVRAGTGPIPKPTDKVKVHYKGTLINGEEFDSSYKRGEPATFGLNQVIKGWTEIVGMMPTGSRWRVVIPPEMAYGERGAGESIPGGATLIFEIELISIE